MSDILKVYKMKRKVKAYAKINLILDIISRARNGYHNLFMIMQSVDLYDTLEIETDESGKITIECDKEGIPLGEKNIAHKAATAFFSFTSASFSGLHIKLEKRIPHAAGLAGGSADAAAVICALNDMYGTDLSYAELVSLGLKVGADVPFCIFGSTRLAQRYGDVLSELPPIPECYIVISKPTQAVPTASAYKDYDAISSRVRHPDDYGMLDAVAESDLDGICAHCDNVFEQAIEVHDRAYIKGTMRQHGAKAACMSGSGPSVFGIFENEKQAYQACEELKKTVGETFVCKPKNCGCEFVG